jgi:pimeloyl-ACP methyl ester carboxylesterase
LRVKKMSRKRLDGVYWNHAEARRGYAAEAQMHINGRKSRVPTSPASTAARVEERSMEPRGSMRRRASVRASWLVLCIPTAVLTLAGLAGAQSPAFTTITGTIGPGATYEIAMPTAPWNGELVVYAHGIGKPSEPVALPNIGPLRESLTSQGFALVYSSFSENGYGAVKDGVQRTHQLRGIFASRVGQPARVYLAGGSLGGLISLMLAERFPEQYDGALSLSGLVGGGAAELKYIGDARVLFDYFFPGVVPGTPFDVPPGIDFSPGGPTYNSVRAALLQGLVAPGQPTLQFASTAKLPGIGAAEIVAAGMNVVGFTVEQSPNLVDVTHGHMAYDNSVTVYSGSADDAALNAGVARYVSEPSATNYMEHYYTPSGNLHIPVITLHNTRDPLVPIFHEQMYADAVQDAGASPYLLQRTMNAFGHAIAFSDAEKVAAFFALVQWVHTGVKPQN